MMKANPENRKFKETFADLLANERVYVTNTEKIGMILKTTYHHENLNPNQRPNLKKVLPKNNLKVRKDGMKSS